uniref:Ribosomal protein S1 n=1 Tax=Sporolithon durum TaxID=48970 RepID=A0A141SD45_9FLOR|nr:ribosomal protein S1 [Sporolithon durum]AMK96213.1 ribosomal protein S1 [Sporolithon durum]
MNLKKLKANQGFTDKDFASLLDEYQYNLNLGDIVAGTIFSEEAQGFLVDIGANIAAYLPKEENALQSKSCKTINIINNTREFFILAYNKHSKQLILSIRRLEYIRAWSRIKQMQAEDIITYLPIQKINKGGFLTIIEGIQAFIPNSHIVDNSIINEVIPCQFLIVNEKLNKIILSNRRAILTKYKNIIHIGQTVEGIITKITHYGIFIKIQQIPALLHISEIGNEHINHIDTGFQTGNKIIVKIIHIDKKQGRLSVSRRNLN